MLFDVDGTKPETPHVGSAISVREAVMMSIIAHLVLFYFRHYLASAFLALAFLVPPIFRTAPAVVPVQPDPNVVRFVDIRPLADRPAPPKMNAPDSDLDRRSATQQKPPDPTNQMPFSRGNTPEYKQGGPQQQQQAASPAPPGPQTPQAPVPADSAPKVLPDIANPATRPAGGSLTQALRNVQRYLAQDNLQNEHGGDAERSDDIQFDSKGVDFGPWLARFKRQVEHNWIVPQAAMFQKGHVVIQFSVLRNGSIIELRVAQPSSVDAFTTSAEQAIKLSNPTAALPTEYPSDSVFFTVTFHYNEELRNP
jgi:TonB family protein